jgi:putative tryptophan/tyrosine transport system substrate-binding protein
MFMSVMQRMTVTLRTGLFFCCLIGFSVGYASAAEPSLIIVSSERRAAYQETASALLEELRRGDTSISASEVQQMLVSEWPNAQAMRPRMQVALGAQACSALVKRKHPAPVLCTLLPRLSFEEILRDNARQVSPQLSALYLNHPFARQLDLLQLALPKARRVGVLWGPESMLRDREAGMATAASKRGLQLVSAHVALNEPVFRGLKRVIEDADVLLALPDGQIFNSGNIQNILLTSFRARIPMQAFSPAYVRAGALLSLYSTPTQIGQQAGMLVRSVLQGQPLGLPEYPSDFVVSVNENVAHALGLSLDANDLTQRLKQFSRVEKSP